MTKGNLNNRGLPGARITHPPSLRNGNNALPGSPGPCALARCDRRGCRHCHRCVAGMRGYARKDGTHARRCFLLRSCRLTNTMPRTSACSRNRRGCATRDYCCCCCVYARAHARIALHVGGSLRASTRRGNDGESPTSARVGVCHVARALAVPRDTSPV